MTSLSKATSICLGVLTLSLTAAGAADAGQLQDVLARGKLIVGTGSTNPPWHFRDEKGDRSYKEYDFNRWMRPAPGDKPDEGQNPALGDRDTALELFGKAVEKFALGVLHCGGYDFPVDRMVAQQRFRCG